jgi:hypothetical protein
LNFDTEIMDLGDWYDTGSYAATVPVSGTYEVRMTATIHYSGTGSKEAVIVYLIKNGSTYLEIADFEVDTHTSSTHPYIATLTTLVPANFGDSFKVAIGPITASGTTVLANHGSTFSMRLLR